MIRARGLRYRYAGGPELAFADIDIPQGGALLVQGRSGAGKSTWLALVAGLREAQGELVVAGESLHLLRGATRDAWRSRAIGFLPQRLHLSDALDVAGNLAVAYFAAGLPRDDAAIGAALGALQVADLATRRPAALSGGQAQRVALARAVLLVATHDARARTALADAPVLQLPDVKAAA